MENKKINKKLVSGILATSLVLSSIGCTKKDQDKPVETVIVYETVVVTATPEPTKVPTNTPRPTTTPIPTNTPTPTEAPRDRSTPPTEYHSADEGLDAFWDSVYNKINYTIWRIDNIDYNEVKESTINHAKELIDFIFYGGEINGITFDELKDDAKQEVYAELQRLDSFIMQFDPDYKEKIGEKYNLVKDFASTTLENAKKIINSYKEKGKNKEKTLVLSNKKSN